eukprot:scaffold146297_cov26-Tisochrysis_lutea.AAC.1
MAIIARHDLVCARDLQCSRVGSRLHRGQRVIFERAALPSCLCAASRLGGAGRGDALLGNGDASVVIAQRTRMRCESMALSMAPWLAGKCWLKCCGRRCGYARGVRLSQLAVVCGGRRDNAYERGHKGCTNRRGICGNTTAIDSLRQHGQYLTILGVPLGLPGSLGGQPGVLATLSVCGSEMVGESVRWQTGAGLGARVAMRALGAGRVWSVMAYLNAQLSAHV